MRTTMYAVLALALAAGCDNKKATPKQGAAGGGATGDQVRAPTADDLAAYTKQLPGSGDKLMARFETPLGTINCELFGDKAPMTVANFVGLATGQKPWLDPRSGETQRGKPFFDGLIFHRVIPGFMIQGGDPTGTGRGGPGYHFDDEFAQGLEMGPGALAMANAGAGTNGSQFFIMEGLRHDLVGHHTIFGQCKEVEVVQKITHTPRGPDDRPNEPVTMKVTITKG